jgi:hypothetical protein
VEDVLLDPSEFWIEDEGRTTPILASDSKRSLCIGRAEFRRLRRAKIAGVAAVDDDTDHG